MARAYVEAVLKGFNLGEGPHWVEERQELLLVDILDQSVHRYDPATGDHFNIKMGGNTSVIIPVDGQPNKYLVGVESNLVLLDWDGSSPEATSVKNIVSTPKKSHKLVHNDGKCDPQGRFYVGTIGVDDTIGLVKGGGNLYSLNLDQSVTNHVDEIGIANGLAWTSDSSKFFYVDSLKGTVDVFDFDGFSGAMSNRQVLFDYKKHGLKGIPDGMAIDSQNNLWVASFMGAEVIHLDTTTGTLIDSISFSGRTANITSCAFGGPNLDILYVTSGAKGASDLVSNPAFSEEPEAGCLFKVTNIGAKGSSGGVSYKGTIA